MLTRFRSLVLVLVFGLPLVAPIRLSARETAATVACKDGTTSKGGKGACSKEPEAAEIGTRVRCNDGSSARKGRGLCSHHGGVDKSAASANPRSMTAAPPGTTSDAPRAGRSGGTSTAGRSTTSGDARTMDTKHSELMSAPGAALPGGATARCKDGTLSASKHDSGTCLNHGGVEQWLDGGSK